MKKHLWLKIILGIVSALFLAFALLILYLSVTEYRPDERQDAEWYQTSEGNAVSIGDSLTIYTWNIGYAGLDSSADFFMDGGSGVNPTYDAVLNNLNAIKDFIASQAADAWLIQELDVSSARTGYVNQLEALSDAYIGSFAMAYNYKCNFVPIPIPPIGKIESGIATFTAKKIKSVPERIALPCPFSWPVSIANLKRCLLITRIEVEGVDKEIVLVNLHLEAYDDGEGKLAQTKQLMDFLSNEYEKGNYVIAGGDFNQIFPKTTETFPISSDSWTPGILEEGSLPNGFSYVFDNKTPTCRLLNKPLDDDNQLYIIDGFIVSPNLNIELIETVDLSFANSDHNPVKLQVTLLPE